MVNLLLLSKSKWNPVTFIGLLSLFTFFTSTHTFGQAQIVCNDNVQASLDGTCQAVIRPDMVLEGPMVLYAPPFTIRISGNGIINNNSNAPIVTNPGLYTVTVTNSQGNSCWGSLRVEDKLPPAVDCVCPPGNTDPACAFACTDETAFFGNKLNYPKPIVSENCGAYTATTSDEIITTSTCGEKIVRRTWIFTDAYGNESVPCITEYRFSPEDVASVTPPYNNVQMTCGADVTMPGIFAFFKAKLFAEYYTAYKLLIPATYPNDAAAKAAADADATVEAGKYAWPTINNVPIAGQTCNLMSTKSDTEILACGPGCANSKKIVRVWTILDWCTSETRLITQVIKATDEEAPTITAEDITVSVDPWDCVGNFLLPLPKILHDNCDANPTYTVQVPIGVRINFDAASGRYLVTGAPKGNHVFTYVATDCCQNEGEYEVNVSIIDRTAPVAVAKQNIVLSLTTGGENDGIAKLFASSVDNGSYDSCSDVYFEIRREDDPTRDEDGCGYTGNKTYNADGHPNDGSSDPASPHYDPDNGQYVKFCCSDITNREGEVPFGIVKVWMRVWDDGDMDGVFGSAGDNYNETWVNVRVEDKLTPRIVCPANVTINCDDDRDDLELTGAATAFSNCLDLEVEYTDRTFLSPCNIGYIIRTWRIKNRPSIVCTQRIDVVNPFPPFEGTIQWPLDVTTNCADNANLVKPTWTAGPCDQIGLSVKSDTFYFEANACMKILNKWTIIDWCTYDPNASAPIGYYTHTQVIKIVDDIKPTLGSCANIMFDINDNDDSDNDGNKCERRNLMLTQTADDQGQCASDWLKWTVFVDLWGDGTMDYEYSSFLPASDVTFNDTNGNGIKDRYVAPTSRGEEVKVTLPEDIVGSMSNHKVTWKVTDGCGNHTSCEQSFMVVDKKKPTPYCLNVSSALMNNGQVELWAVDFNIGSFDNCTPQSGLLYTFNEANPVLTRLNEVHYFKGAGLNATEAEYFAGNAQKWLPGSRSAGMVFDCDDLPSTEVKMTVWDEKLNYDFCVVTLNLADNQGACTNDLTTSVSGKLVSHNGDDITTAEVTLTNIKPEMNKSTYSNLEGDYRLNGAVMYQDYDVTVQKNDNYLNGVSTIDLVLIQRHLLDINRFNNPYHMIAADANSDQKITASDLVELRKLILGINTKFTNSPNWRFINSNQSFPSVQNPWPLVEKINILDLDHAMINQNFIGVKIGDVDGSAKGDAQDTETDTRSTVAMTSPMQYVNNGVRTHISASLSDEVVYGLQATLVLNDATLNAISINGQELSEDYVAQIGENMYTISWNDALGVDGDNLMDIQITPHTDGNIDQFVHITSELINAEIYTGQNLATNKLSLRFVKDAENSFALYQNEPNPFTDNTQLSFVLPENGTATISIMDVTGKILYNESAVYNKGINTITLNAAQTQLKGVMICKLEYRDSTATIKMIGLE